MGYVARGRNLLDNALSLWLEAIFSHPGSRPIEGLITSLDLQTCAVDGIPGRSTEYTVSLVHECTNIRGTWCVGVRYLQHWMVVDSGRGSDKG